MKKTIYVTSIKDATPDDMRIVGQNVALTVQDAYVLPDNKVSEYFDKMLSKFSSVHIFGYAEDRSLYTDDKRIEPRYSQGVRNHSPDGFNWGYHGSGCAQTALAILLELLPKELATMLYQKFKSDFVSKWEMGKDFDVTINFYEWLHAKLTKEDYHDE